MKRKLKRVPVYTEQSNKIWVGTQKFKTAKMNHVLAKGLPIYRLLE